MFHKHILFGAVSCQGAVGGYSSPLVIVLVVYAFLFNFRLDQMFSDAFSRDYQLLKSDPKHSLYLACALMVRGNVEISDVRRNIEK